MSARRDQVFVGFKCDPEFRAELERASGGALSQFVREALITKLQSMGIHVDESLASAPSRMGKGGPRKKVSTVPSQAATAINSPGVVQNQIQHNHVHAEERLAAESPGTYKAKKKKRNASHKGH